MAVNREDIIIDVDGAREAERDLDSVGKSFDGLSKSIGAAVAGFVSLQGAMKVVEFAQAGAQIQQVDVAFSRLGGTAEQVDATFQALGGTVDRNTIKRLSNTARALGITGDQFQQLSKVALASSKALGRDVTESLGDVVTGTARFSREILDNLGLQVSVGQANEAYARALNKSAASLSEAEKRQAFFNAVMKAGETLTEQVGSNVEGAAGNFARLATSITEAKDAVSVFIAELTSPAAAAASDALNFLYGSGRSDVRGDQLSRAKANLEEVNAEIRELSAQLAPVLRGRERGEEPGFLSDLFGSKEANDRAIERLRSLKREALSLQREITVRGAAFVGPPLSGRGAAPDDGKKPGSNGRGRKRTATTAEPFDIGRALQDRAREQAAAGIALQEEALRAEAQLEQERMRLVAEGVEARIKARRQERADFLAGQQAQLDASLGVISAINAQAGAYARLGVSIDETGQQVVDSSAIMKAVGVDALASIGSALGDAAVAALFYGESFSKALGDALVQAGASAIGFAISGAAIAGVLAFISPAQAAAVGAASLAAGVAGTTLVAIGKGMGGDISTGGVESMAPGGSGGAIGRGSPSERAERDFMRDRRRSRNMQDQQEVTIIINNSLGGERVDRAIHRAATRGARFDRPRRAGAM